MYPRTEKELTTSCVEWVVGEEKFFNPQDALNAAQIALGAANRPFYDEKARREKEFQSDLFDALGLTDNPYRMGLYKRAYQIGFQDGGWYSVYEAAEDLAEIFQ